MSSDNGTLIPLKLFATKKSSNAAMDLVWRPPNTCVLMDQTKN